VNASAQLHNVTRAYVLGVLSLEELRDALVDLVDDIDGVEDDDRRLYGAVWERLSEFDYSHIDEGEMRWQVSRLLGDVAPKATPTTAARAVTQSSTAAWPTRLDISPAFRSRFETSVMFPAAVVP
jgi:hypothetical protein